MIEDAGRAAAVAKAAELIEPGMLLGLGSGRAVFALTHLIGEKFGNRLTAVVASPQTAEIAAAAGIKVIELGAETALDLAIDGADEVDNQLHLIKGGGAALLREKLVIAAAAKTVILAEDRKLVDRLGSTHTLAVEVVPFAWGQTQRRVAKLIDNPALRADAQGAPVVTANGNYLLDGHIEDSGDLQELADNLATTLGVVEHGLFLDQASEVHFGRQDGTVTTLFRS